MRVVPDWICHLLCGAVHPTQTGSVKFFMVKFHWVHQSSLHRNPVWIQCKCIIKEPTNPVWIQSNCATKKVANPVWTQWNFTAALRVRTLCGFRRFGGRLPPLWGIGLLVFFLPWRTAREFLPPLRAWLDSGNSAKILIISQKSSRICKNLGTSKSLKLPVIYANDLEPPLYNRKLFHRKCHQKLSLSAEKGCAAPVAEERSSRHAMPAARLLFPVRRSSIGSRLAFWAPLWYTCIGSRLDLDPDWISSLESRL